MEGAFCAWPIQIEARLERGLPKFQIYGLAANHARETAERIRNALQATAISIPYMSISINLAPVDLRKKGAYLDLAIALSVLHALEYETEYQCPPSSAPGSKQKQEACQTLYVGELSLSGAVRPIQQLHAILWEARKAGFQRVVLPQEQYELAAMIPGLELRAIAKLQDLLPSSKTSASSVGIAQENSANQKLIIQPARPPLRMAHLQLGPRIVKAAALCAAGWHSMLLIGPPGCGKSSIAREIVSLLPPPSMEEAIEILIAQQSEQKAGSPLAPKKEEIISISRPMRMPHHSITRRALVGGGSPIQAGEISRAHNGVLVLDELAEFSRESLQALREPLEQRKIELSKGEHALSLPAHFLLCASANPCPCGDISKRYERCACTDHYLRNYMSKFTGALRDRIDIEVWIGEQNKEANKPLASYDIAKSVACAQQIQAKRFAQTSLGFNADIADKDMDRYAPLQNQEAIQEWEGIIQSGKFSYRALARIRRLARTLADLEEAEDIRAQDLLEASSYRCLDSIWP